MNCHSAFSSSLPVIPTGAGRKARGVREPRRRRPELVVQAQPRSPHSLRSVGMTGEGSACIQVRVLFHSLHVSHSTEFRKPFVSSVLRVPDRLFPNAEIPEDQVEQILNIRAADQPVHRAQGQPEIFGIQFRFGRHHGPFQRHRRILQTLPVPKPGQGRMPGRSHRRNRPGPDRIQQTADPGPRACAHAETGTGRRLRQIDLVGDGDDAPVACRETRRPTVRRPISRRRRRRIDDVQDQIGIFRPGTGRAPCLPAQPPRPPLRRAARPYRRRRPDSRPDRRGPR